VTAICAAMGTDGELGAAVARGMPAMMSAIPSHIPGRCKPPTGPLCASAALLALLAGAAPACAQQPCPAPDPSVPATVLCNEQAAGEAALLLPFNSLPDTAAGMAVLRASLQTEESIYLNSTQAQKIAAGTAFIIDDLYANVLLRAFPHNPNFGYSQEGLPSAPALPAAVQAEVDAIDANASAQLATLKLGLRNDYGKVYGLLPNQQAAGNPAPYQVSAAIQNNPFTAANSSQLAAQNQQVALPYNVNWANPFPSGDFPSAHTMGATFNAITFAILAPGYYQQLALSVAEFAYDLNVFGEHFPVDVIGGRILGTFVMGQALSGNPLYSSGFLSPASVAALSHQMQGYLGGGASSPFATACASVASCVASGTVIPTAAAYTQAAQRYMSFLTYGLPPVSDTSLPPVVPAGASSLIATRFPYLNAAQLDQVIATTELPSGLALDNGSGWARINLYAAASGYGAFPSAVTVNMNAALGGLNAFDIWSNNISGPGGLTLQGSGSLILAGNDSYTGGTSVQGGTLAVTGTLGGSLAISPGATFVSKGGYAVAGNATLANAGTFVEVNTPLINAGSATNTGMFVGSVSNSGVFTNSGVVTGAFSNSGRLAGSGAVGSLALLAGSVTAPGNPAGSQPGTIQVAENLTVAAGAVYQVRVGADRIVAGGTAALSGGTVAAASASPLPLGNGYPVLTAAGGVSGSFGALTQPAGAPGTRLDAIYGSNTVSLVTTPGSYGGPGAPGVTESSSERAIGGALDAVRPPPGVAMASAQSAVFGPLYLLPAGSITVGLDELAPSIYADGMITARNAWFTMANAVSGELAARRGLAGDQAASSAPGPGGGTVWVSGLGGYYANSAGGGSPGFTAGLGGAAVGFDMPVAAGSGRAGVAVGTVDGQTWSQASGQATNSTAQAAVYGQWRKGMFFAEGQLGLMYQKETVHRTLPLFGASAQGSADGLAAGGGVRAGLQKKLGAWLIEPSIGFGGFTLRMNGLTETGGGALAENIGGAALSSAQSTLAVSAQRTFAAGETVQVTAKGRLGWSHEFADNTALVSASFAGLGGSGFALNSAPVGRDAAVAGLGADVKVASWPVTLFAGYGGAFNGSTHAQSFSGGVRFRF
jgi:outer membrane autotransporter protein